MLGMCLSDRQIDTPNNKTQDKRRQEIESTSCMSVPVPEFYRCVCVHVCVFMCVCSCVCVHVCVSVRTVPPHWWLSHRTILAAAHRDRATPRREMEGRGGGGRWG
jgi:hypothetical protein